VSEGLLLGPMLAAEAEGIPGVLLTSTVYMLPAPGVPPFGPGFQPARGPLGRVRDRLFGALGRKGWEKGLDALNAGRAEHGLAPLDSVFDQYERAERLLVLSSAALDFEATALPASVRHVGPRLDDIHGTEPWTAPEGADPLVLVGLSTTYQDQLPVLQRVVDALGRLPVRALVTTGEPVDPAALDAAPNVEVVRTAPHSEVLREAAAVVTHAGHGTVVKALAQGVPLVCLPMGRDQAEVAARVVAAGAGLRVKPKASPDAIGRAVARVLGEPSFRTAAERLRDAIAAEHADDLAVAELERVAQPGEPGGGGLVIHGSYATTDNQASLARG
jgi:MGT family glycosyltransferase